MPGIYEGVSMPALIYRPLNKFNNIKVYEICKYWETRSSQVVLCCHDKLERRRTGNLPAFTDYSLKRKNFEKDKVFKAIDKSKLLPTVVCFCDAKPFYAENVPLYDYVGNKIKNLPDNAPAVMVYLDKADNVNLLGLTDEPLQAELVECDSVSEGFG